MSAEGHGRWCQERLERPKCVEHGEMGAWIQQRLMPTFRVLVAGLAKFRNSPLIHRLTRVHPSVYFGGPLL